MIEMSADSNYLKIFGNLIEKKWDQVKKSGFEPRKNFES